MKRTLVGEVCISFDLEDVAIVALTLRDKARDIRRDQRGLFLSAEDQGILDRHASALERAGARIFKAIDPEGKFFK